MGREQDLACPRLASNLKRCVEREPRTSKLPLFPFQAQAGLGGLIQDRLNFPHGSTQRPWIWEPAGWLQPKPLIQQGQQGSFRTHFQAAPSSPERRSALRARRLSTERILPDSRWNSRAHKR